MRNHPSLLARCRQVLLWSAFLLLTPTCLAGEPAILPTQPAMANTPSATPAPSSAASVSPVAPSNKGQPQTSEVTHFRWIDSFPESQRRSIGRGTHQRNVLLWPPQQHWRGEVVLLPGAGNAVHRQGPLLELAKRLARTGWRCWIVARETPPSDETGVTPSNMLASEELQSLLSMVASEAPPTDAAPIQTGRLPFFLLAQADATTLAWNEAYEADARFGGIVILGAAVLPDKAPKLPILELQIAEQARDVPAAAAARQQRWQHLPQYQQQTLLTSARIPVLPWLGNTVDGWLRKVAAQPTARNNAPRPAVQ